MHIHRRLIIVVGLGMLLIMTIAVYALQNMAAVFSSTTRNVERLSLEVQRVWKIEKETTRMSMDVHDYVASGQEKYRSAYNASRASVLRMLDEIKARDLSPRYRELLASTSSDFAELNGRADRIFSLEDPAGRNRVLARGLMVEIDGLLERMGGDIDTYKEGSGAQMGELVDYLRVLKIRVNILFVVIMITAIAFLLAFGLYLHRTVSLPLGELWKGAEAISRGNLDYRMAPQGEGDIARLAERFNDMARKLKASYADLETKVLDRTRELAALSSVSLVLGQQGSLRDVLHNSLVNILGSMSKMEPRGGIFLVDPDGKHLRLVVQEGLSKEFSRDEEVINMGECLCGMVAQTGELLFTGEHCEDPRHTRGERENGHSHIIIPIKSRGTILGVVFLYPARELELSPSDIQMLDTMGVLLGIAVENSRLYGQMKESGEKYRDLFQHSHDILFTTDRNGTLTSVNEAAVNFSGYQQPELIGRNVTDFLTDAGSNAALKAFAGEPAAVPAPADFEVVKKDGAHAFVEISARKMYKDAEPVGYQISARDVTEQKKLHEMLVKAERLAAIFQVGIAVRHEINNPLTTVIGNAELLLDRAGDIPAAMRKRLQAILDNAIRIAEIVKRLEEIKKEQTVEYLKGVRMTDLKRE